MTSRAHNDAYAHLGTEAAALKDQLKELAAALEQVGKTEGAEAAKAVADKARKTLSRANELVEDLALGGDKAKRAAIEGREHLEESIRKQPLLAIGIAAAAGFLLASLRRH